MNYAANSVCADQHKAQGTFSRVSVKICNEFQVHHFLMEGEKTSINANFPQFLGFYEYFTAYRKDEFLKCNLRKLS